MVYRLKNIDGYFSGINKNGINTCEDKNNKMVRTYDDFVEALHFANFIYGVLFIKLEIVEEKE